MRDPTPEDIRLLILAASKLLQEPGYADYPLKDCYGSNGKPLSKDGEAHAPFWSEVGLYGRVGKEAGRTLLTWHEKLRKAVARCVGVPVTCEGTRGIEQVAKLRNIREHVIVLRELLRTADYSKADPLLKVKVEQVLRATEDLPHDLDRAATAFEGVSW